MSVGPTELLLIALVVFLLFGTGRLADVGKGLGEGIRNFKRGLAGTDEEAAKDEKSKEPPKQLTGRVATSGELPSGDASSAASDVAKNDATKADESAKKE
jgi:sec-independent protein translocase protein TatA